MSPHKSAPEQLAPAARVTRGNGVEAVHCAAIAVVNAAGELTHRLGDASSEFFARSALKPLQVLPLIERGGLQRFAFDDRELALCAASHSGMDLHRELVAGMLAKLGLTEQALGCGGAADGLASPTSSRPDALRHNCSGKHCGFLALARMLGQPVADYLSPDGATQAAVRARVADACGLKAEQLPTGIDGCSAPNYALPLVTLAQAFAKLAIAPEATPLGRVRRAMLAHPLLVSGPGRFDHALSVAFPGKLVAKSGAEGLQLLAFTDPPVAIAIKVLDGAARALGPIVVETLRQLGRTEEPERLVGLEAWKRVPILNARGLTTGFVEAGFELVRGAAA